MHVPQTLTHSRRISQGHHNLTGTQPISLLRDIDQPFNFEVSFGKRRYRLEFYDTSSPDSWRLLQPDLVLVCYDISQRLSLINLKRIVRRRFPPALIILPTDFLSSLVDQRDPRDLPSDRGYVAIGGYWSEAGLAVRG